MRRCIPNIQLSLVLTFVVVFAFPGMGIAQNMDDSSDHSPARISADEPVPIPLGLLSQSKTGVIPISAQHRG